MKLTDEQWATLSRLIDEALALSPPEREAWLATLPSAVDGFGATLRDLLARHASGATDDFLKTLPSFAPAPLAGAGGTPLREGAVVGPYRLLRELGRGGMGSVWLAERTDGQLKRPVALKLPHAGPQATQFGERFARERDILAALAHPHIARLYDAGVAPDGQSFLALEYVAGEPLGAYCDARRLDVAQRLALFLQVLDAVQYAHAHLVMHRDLKPSNILVSDDGEVELLDFGIAKLIARESAPESALTQAASRLLTPDYASPEQVAGASLTTATDVYSLGVILYELLTGERPYRLKRESRGALEEAILEAAVARPSAACRDEAKAEARRLPIAKLQRLLHGDLDNIVLAALKKNPAERYASVTAFADDIRRYLAHEPVSARPDSIGYRAAKFVRRNRLAVGLATLAVVTLIGGLAGTITQAGRATRQAALAEQERQRADEQARAATEQRDFALRELSHAAGINELNQFLLSDAAPSGKPFTAGELLARAETIVEREHGESDANHAEMLVAIGSQYNATDQGAKARQLLGRAYEISRGLPERETRARAACTLASAVGRAGDRDRAEALLREGIADLPDEPQYTLDRISCLLDGSLVARDANDARLAIARAKAAQALLPQLRYPSAVLELNVLMDLAASYDQADQFPAAVEMFEHANAQLVALGRENTAAASALYNNWGLTLHLMGQTLKAEELFRKAISISSADGTDKNVLPMRLANLSRTLLALGRDADAARTAELAYTRARATGDEIVVSQSLLMRAQAYRNLGDYVRAEQVVNEAEPRYLRPGQDPIGAASIIYERAMLAQARGETDAAMAGMNKAVAISEKRGTDRMAQAVFALRRAEFELSMQRFDPAVADARTARRLFLEVSGAGAASSYVGRCYLVEGRALATVGRDEEARGALSSALEQLRPTVGADHPQAKLAERLLASAAGVSR
jgi:serine/threonine-protein kinase